MNTRDTSLGVAALGAADRLSLAAAPAFAIMALLASVSGGGPPDMLCAAAREVPPLGGMVPMYVLMSAFHLTPWLKLISRAFPASGGGQNGPDLTPPPSRLT